MIREEPRISNSGEITGGMWDHDCHFSQNISYSQHISVITIILSKPARDEGETVCKHFPPTRTRTSAYKRHKHVNKEVRLGDPVI